MGKCETCKFWQPLGVPFKWWSPPKMISKDNMGECELPLHSDQGYIQLGYNDTNPLITWAKFGCAAHIPVPPHKGDQP